MELDHPDLPFLLALHLALDLYPTQQVTLLNAFGSARAVFAAGPQAWGAQAGLKSEMIEALKAKKYHEQVDVYLSKMQKLGIGVLSFREKDYPQRLLNTASFPPLLFYRGDATLLNSRHSLGIVGSRDMTEYGERVCADFVPRLTEKEVTIVSGLAFGVDAAGHEACLKSGGKTVAVLAQGVDRSYPTGNFQIFEAICRDGCVVSEFAFPLKKGGETFLFPRRNRIISALSDLILVVEARKNSGALITANYALEQNRSVFAVPGTIYQNMSEGCLDLLRQGAGVAMDVQVLLDDLGLLSTESKKLREKKIETTCSMATDFFETPLEKNIFLLCQKSPCAMDDLLESIEASASVVSATATKMELMGRLKTVAGRKFVAMD